MVKLESLKKSNQFKKALKEKKIHSNYFSIFAAKNFYKPKRKSDLLISFVMKKKIGNAVIRNKIKRKLKYAVQKILKEKQLIDLNYTYVIFGKNNVYKDKFANVLHEANETFKKINRVGVKL